MGARTHTRNLNLKVNKSRLKRFFLTTSDIKAKAFDELRLPAALHILSRVLIPRRSKGRRVRIEALTSTDTTGAGCTLVHKISVEALRGAARR